MNTHLKRAKQVDATRLDILAMSKELDAVIQEASRLQVSLKAAIDLLDGKAPHIESNMRPIDAFREFLAMQDGPFHIEDARDYVYARVTNCICTGTLNVMLFNATKRGHVRRVTGREDPRRPGKHRTGWYEVVREVA